MTALHLFALRSITLIALAVFMPAVAILYISLGMPGGAFAAALLFGGYAAHILTAAYFETRAAKEVPDA